MDTLVLTKEFEEKMISEFSIAVMDARRLRLTFKKGSLVRGVAFLLAFICVDAISIVAHDDASFWVVREAGVEEDDSSRAFTFNLTPRFDNRTAFRFMIRMVGLIEDIEAIPYS